MFRTTLATLTLVACMALSSLSSAPAQASPSLTSTYQTDTPLAPSCGVWYTVRPGDWLSRIAARYALSWQRLAAANGLRDPNLIYPGQRLCVPSDGGGAGAGGQAWPHAVYHAARYADTAMPGQCTWYAAHMRPDLDLRWAGNAHAWATTARLRGYAVGSLPAVGSIAVFAPGVDGANSWYGHVAYVIAVRGSAFEVAAMAAPDVWVVSASWHATKSGVQFIYG